MKPKFEVYSKRKVTNYSYQSLNGAQWRTTPYSLTTFPKQSPLQGNSSHPILELYFSCLLSWRIDWAQISGYTSLGLCLLVLSGDFRSMCIERTKRKMDLQQVSATRGLSVGGRSPLRRSRPRRAVLPRHTPSTVPPCTPSSQPCLTRTTAAGSPSENYRHIIS